MKHKHIGFSDSIVMRELEKIARDKNLVEEELYIPILNKKASTDLVSTGDVFMDTINLAKALRMKGFPKQAIALENQVIEFKKTAADIADNPYDWWEEKGDSLLEHAHSEDKVELPSSGGFGLIEDEVNAHDKIMRLVEKAPTGKIAKKNTESKNLVIQAINALAVDEKTMAANKTVIRAYGEIGKKLEALYKYVISEKYTLKPLTPGEWNSDQRFVWLINNYPALFGNIRNIDKIKTIIPQHLIAKQTAGFNWAQIIQYLIKNPSYLKLVGITGADLKKLRDEGASSSVKQPINDKIHKFHSGLQKRYQDNIEAMKGVLPQMQEIVQQHYQNVYGSKINQMIEIYSKYHVSEIFSKNITSIDIEIPRGIISQLRAAIKDFRDTIEKDTVNNIIVKGNALPASYSYHSQPVVIAINSFEKVLYAHPAIGSLGVIFSKGDIIHESIGKSLDKSRQVLSILRKMIAIEPFENSDKFIKEVTHTVNILERIYNATENVTTQPYGIVYNKLKGTKIDVDKEIIPVTTYWKSLFDIAIATKKSADNALKGFRRLLEEKKQRQTIEIEKGTEYLKESKDNNDHLIVKNGFDSAALVDAVGKPVPTTPTKPSARVPYTPSRPKVTDKTKKIIQLMQKRCIDFADFVSARKENDIKINPALTAIHTALTSARGINLDGVWGANTTKALQSIKDYAANKKITVGNKIIVNAPKYNKQLEKAAISNAYFVGAVAALAGDPSKADMLKNLSKLLPMDKIPTEFTDDYSEVDGGIPLYVSNLRSLFTLKKYLIARGFNPVTPIMLEETEKVVEF